MSHALQSRQARSSVDNHQPYAAVLRKPRSFEITKTDQPEIGDEQVLIRLEGCGVCGSNLPIWEGRRWFDYPQPPGAPGHEGWGVIEALGSNVGGLQLGQRVACLSYQAFASHDVADASHVVALPKAIDHVPFPAEPLACAINVMRRCNVRKGDGVAIIGIGFLGALLTQLLENLGVSVTAISRRSFALEIAEKCGARKVFSFNDPHLTEHCGDQFCCVVEATGNQQALDLATSMVGYAGKLVIAGYHQDGPRQVNMQQWNWKGIYVINAHQRDPMDYIDGIREAVDAVRANSLEPNWLITHQFPLAEINQAFDVAHRRPAGFLKSIVVIDNVT